MEVLNKKLDELDKFAAGVPQLRQIADKAKVRPAYLCLAALIVAPILILFFLGGAILSVVLTVVYPAFKSIQALETKGDDDDDKQWLTYWVIFGFFTLADEMFGWLLEFIPFYFYIRLVFFIYMFAPQTQGAIVIYRTVLHPVLVKYQHRIDEIIAQVQGASAELAKEAKEAAQKELSKPENQQKMWSAANELHKQADKIENEAEKAQKED